MNARLATIRQEVHGFVDTLPETQLAAIKPLLEMLSVEWMPVVETNLTDEEKEIIREGRTHRAEHPEEYVSQDEAEKIIYGEL